MEGGRFWGAVWDAGAPHPWDASQTLLKAHWRGWDSRASHPGTCRSELSQPPGTILGHPWDVPAASQPWDTPGTGSLSQPWDAHRATFRTR